MREGNLVQFASPDELLSAPADDFVVNLVGGNYSIKRLHLMRVEEVIDEKPYTAESGDSVEKAKELLDKSKVGLVIVVDEDKKIKGLVEPSSLKKPGEVISDIMEEIQDTVTTEATLNDALSVMLTNGEGYVIVLDAEDRVDGIVTLNSLMEAL